MPLEEIIVGFAESPRIQSSANTRTIEIMGSSKQLESRTFKQILQNYG